MMEPMEFTPFLKGLGSEVAEILKVDRLRLLLETETPDPDPALAPVEGVLMAVERGFIGRSQQARVRRDACIMWAVYAAIALVSVATGSTAALTFWLLPRILGEPVMRVIRMSEHGACPLVPDMLENTRTVRTWRPIQWLNWNMAYHAEHHAIPAVPFHALPALHGHLAPHLAELEQGYASTQARILEKAARGGGRAVAN